MSINGENEEEEEEEEEEIPEDIRDLPVEKQQWIIKKRSFMMMALGTALVLIFSDPMVDVFGRVGQLTDIPPFYISFILAPLASNASEVLASYSFALKKTKKTISVSLIQLEGGETAGVNWRIFLGGRGLLCFSILSFFDWLLSGHFVAWFF